MKFVLSSIATLLCAAAGEAASSSTSSFSTLSDKPMSPTMTRSLLSKARRRLDQQQQDDDKGQQALVQVEDYIMDYSIKFTQCLQEYNLDLDAAGDNDDNAAQFGVIIFRLCPSDKCYSNNDGTTKDVCDSGYAEFAISLQDFVDSYLEDQRDNMMEDGNWDDQGNLDDFAYCSQYYPEEQEENENGYVASYYVGPACSEDGLSVRLGLFKDEYCSRLYDSSRTTFESVSGGWSLPFADGGLVSTNCISCVVDDDGNNNNNNADLRDLCLNLYEYAPYKCETEWGDVTHYYWDEITEIYRYGKDETGCRPISKMTYMPEPKPNELASIIILSLLVIGSVVGAIAYSIWWKKSTCCCCCCSFFGLLFFILFFYTFSSSRLEIVSVYFFCL